VRARLGLALFGALRLRTRAHPTTTTVVALRSTSASCPCARGIPRAAALVNINIGFSPLCSGYTARSQSGSPVPCGYVCDNTLGRCAFKLSTNRVAVTTDRALVNLDVLLTGSNNVLTGVRYFPFAARAAVWRVRARLGLALFGALRACFGLAFGELCGRAALNIGLSPLCSGYTARSSARQHRLSRPCARGIPRAAEAARRSPVAMYAIRL